MKPSSAIAHRLSAIPPLTARVLDEIAHERARQGALLAAGKFTTDVASDEFGCFSKLPVLIEEVGEVGKALCELNEIINGITGTKKDVRTVLSYNLKRAELRTELIQVAAVATAWAESLTPSKPSRPSCDKKSRSKKEAA